MKRVCIFVLVSLVIGCAGDREWLKHDTAFASGSHWYFSWLGYRNADMKDVHMSKQEGWWGKIVYVESTSVSAQ